MEPKIAGFVGKFRSWIQGLRAGHQETVDLFFMLRRSPLVRSRLEEALLEVSTPGSARYGQHLSKAEAELLAPPVDGAQKVVLDWLETHGVKGRGAVVVRSDVVEAKIPVEVAETMFNTTLHHYMHRDLGADLIRASAPYSVPAEVARVLYVVGDLVQLPALDKSPRTFPKKASHSDQEQGFPGDCGEVCGGFTTPGVLRAAYNIPVAPHGQNTTMAIAQFQGVSWDKADLDSFTHVCHLDAPVKVHDQRGYNNPRWCQNLLTADICLESLLDVEYIKAIGGDIPLTVLSDTDYSLLRWAMRVADMNNPPPVHSVSYGNDENQQDSEEYMDSVNDQFMLLGLRGISILFASGDMGVYGRTGVTEDGMFHPDFPAGSPYVTAVGGTDFVRQGAIGAEEAWPGSGGGFSDHFEMPKWQKKAVRSYLKLAPHRPGFPDGLHFHTGGRGYPDVSALGGQKNPYCVDTTGLFGTHMMMGVAGTSASCPVVAGVFARLNALRNQSDLPPLGFLNPFIYQNPDAFNDVQKGDNRWQGPEGFQAVKGWDPSTGMGTPNFEKLAKAAISTATHKRASPEALPDMTAFV